MDTKPTTQTVFTQCLITPTSSGFGMYEAKTFSPSPLDSYSTKLDLLVAIGENTGLILCIEEALTNPLFMDHGIADIRGRIYGRHGELWAEIECGVVSYFGIIESEVSENFFD